MWDDIFDIRPTNKEMAALILGVFVFLVAAFSLGYMLGVERTRENVHDNGNGINHVGEQLGETVSHQQQITSGVQDAEHTSSGIAETGAAIKESAVHIEAGVGEAAGLIDSSQQILGRIRNRGQEGTPAN
jgi:hypothetical protein